MKIRAPFVRSGAAGGAFERGVSVLAGLPTPMTTPAHGTAFDIVGQAKANLVPAKNAFTMCLNMASNRNATSGVEGALAD